MNLKKFTFLIVILASMASSAQANNCCEVDRSDLLQVILEHAEFCVKGCSEERVYLQEEKIYPTAQGLLLSVNDQGDFVSLPFLLSDAAGCFLEVAPTGFAFDKRPTKPCPFCGWPRLSGAFKCRNENCPSNKKK